MGANPEKRELNSWPQRISGSRVIESAECGVVAASSDSHTPITGRKCIYVCEGYTTRILDIPESESRKLLDLLFAQVTKSEYKLKIPVICSSGAEVLMGLLATYES
jgi:hypothetical protein